MLFSFRNFLLSRFRATPFSNSFSRLFAAAALTPILIATSAHAVPLRDLSGLQDITVFERTGGVQQFTFDPDGVALQTRLAGLGTGVFDFRGTSREFYDVFLSDDDGTLNIDGAFITIETVFVDGLGGGGNINGVQLNFAGGGTELANDLASFVAGGNGHRPGTEIRAADNDLGSFTVLGTTSAERPRLRLTLGFASSATAAQPVAEPGTLALFGSALLGLAALRRRMR